MKTLAVRQENTCYTTSISDALFLTLPHSFKDGQDVKTKLEEIVSQNE